MVNVASKQSIGKRDNQEDACKLVFQDEQDPGSDILMVLSDGMGGHAGGEVASELACQAFVRHFVSDAKTTKPRARLELSLHSANAAVGDKVAKDPELKGMGCTLIGAVKIDNRLSFVSVGDSVIFLSRNGKLSRLNADHSLYGELNEMVHAGKITQAEADAHPKRNALRAAVMGSPIPLVDLDVLDLQPDDLILLATDGLETLSDVEINKILSKERRPDVRAICSDLLNAVETKNKVNQDNTTIIAFRHATGERTSSSPNSQWSILSDFPETKPKTRPLLLVLAVILIILLAVLIVWIGTRNEIAPAPRLEQTEETAPVSPGPSQSIEGGEQTPLDDELLTPPPDVDVPDVDPVPDDGELDNTDEDQSIRPSPENGQDIDGTGSFGSDTSLRPRIRGRTDGARFDTSLVAPSGRVS